MNRKFYDRYEGFRVDNGFSPIPYIKIPEAKSDKKVVYNSNSRLDMISQEYYGSPYFGWLILQANPTIASMEFDIPDNEILRVPFPLDNGINSYINAVKEHKRLNG
jgi:hypothetical protein